MDRQGFGGFITRARLKKAMSLRETAEKLGISPMYLSDVERGRRSAFTLNKLRSFASITGLTGEETAEMFDSARTAYTYFVDNYPEHSLAADTRRMIDYLGMSPEEMLEAILAKAENN